MGRGRGVHHISKLVGILMAKDQGTGAQRNNKYHGFTQHAENINAKIMELFSWFFFCHVLIRYHWINWTQSTWSHGLNPLVPQSWSVCERILKELNVQYVIWTWWMPIPCQTRHQLQRQGLKLTLIPRSDFLLLLSKSWSKSDRHRSYFLSLKPDIWLDWVAKLCS